MFTRRTHDPRTATRRPMGAGHGAGAGMSTYSHTITITVEGKYIHGQDQHACIMLSGDGSLEHMVEAFNTALVAAGFAADTAYKLDEVLEG